MIKNVYSNLKNITLLNVTLIELTSILDKECDFDTHKLDKLQTNDAHCFIYYFNKMNMTKLNVLCDTLKSMFTRMQFIVLKNRNIILHNSLQKILGVQISKFISYNDDFNKKICYNNNISLSYFNDKNKIATYNIKKIENYFKNKVLELESELLPMANDSKIVEEINSLENCLIIVMGPPKVGKTTLSKKLNGTVLTYKRGIVSHKMIKNSINQFFDDSCNNQNLIIDCQNSSIEDRKFYIDTCKYIRNMESVCIKFEYSENAMKYLNNLKNYDLLKERFNIGITKYYKNLTKVSVVEGYNKIHTINKSYFDISINKVF